MILWLAMPGCDKDPADKTGVVEHPYAGESVTVAIPKEIRFGDAWKGVLDEWCEETGARCQIVEYAADDAPEKNSPLGDLIVLPIANLAEFADGDRLAPIPRKQMGTGSSLSWLDFFPGLRDRAVTFGPGPAVIPYSCPVLTCYLRHDLLEKAGLKPPETWDDYQVLVDTCAKWAPGLVVAEPWNEDFRPTMFLARAMAGVKSAASYSVFFDIDTGAPLIDSPGFVQPLKRVVAGFSKLSADAKHLTPADCRRLILTGKAAIAITFEPGRVNAESIRREQGISLACIRLPGARKVFSRQSKSWEAPLDREVNFATLAPFSGLAAAVPNASTARRAEAAWNLATFLSVTRYDQAFANVPKSICRESQLSTAATWSGPELRSAELFSFLGASAESLRETNVVAEISVVGRTEFRKALTEGLTAALEGKASPEEALKNVAEKWRAISKNLGVERVRDSYRQRLGLSPAIKMPAPIPSDSAQAK